MKFWQFAATFALCVLLAAGPARAAPTVLRAALFPVEFDDSSMQPPSPAELHRVAAVGTALREQLAASGRYAFVDTAAVETAARQRDLFACHGCEAPLARQVGAQVSVVAWVQKVSNLILNINAVVRDVATGRAVAAGSVDIRGNTDESWARGVRYLVVHRLLTQPAPMTRMLASVTGPEEAVLALAGGADIIDLKDPSQGALGAVAPDVVRASVAMVAGRRPVSAVAGDLPMQPATVLAAAQAMAQAGAAMVKVGFFPGGDAAGCIRALAKLAGGTRLVAVLFADREPDLGLLPLLAASGFAGAMLDTAEKRGRGLLQAMALPRLRDFVDACRAERLIAGLAGALETPDVPRLLPLRPDVLGFRGALCGAGDRRGRLDPAAVQTIRGLIPAEAAGGPAVDHRLLAARLYAQGATEPGQVDRIFVRDLVLPVRIGAYAREVGTPQRVRFSVEAAVSLGTRPSQDMRDVFSYDIISDGIRLLVEGGHVPLVETLAERIAAMLLQHRRVVQVRVQVEKLDTGSGVVGVVIERTRAAAALMGAASDDV